MKIKPKNYLKCYILHGIFMQIKTIIYLTRKIHVFKVYFRTFTLQINFNDLANFLKIT